MHIEQFFVEYIAHSAYLLCGERTCAAIDPPRDTEQVLQAARRLGMRITHVLLTHLHADFVSGHMDLAASTGARIVAPRTAGCSFEHLPVSEGVSLAFESVRATVLETPGHTPEHVSYVAADLSRGPDPVAVFCGDTLFVGDVGRPDLFPGRAGELASLLYESLHRKLLALPDHCLVCPAHGAGSLCGSAIGAMRTSTVGYERAFNRMLSLGREEFAAGLTRGMPPVPDHFARCSSENAAGPPLLSTLPAPRELDAAEFASLVESGAVVIDSRSYESFGGMHVPGSLSIDMSGNFPILSGWVVPPGRDILVVTGDEAAAREAVAHLRRVGLDRVAGHLGGGIYSWARAGNPVNRVFQVSPCELASVLDSDEKWNVIDVRSPAEFRKRRLRNSINIPVADLRTRAAGLPPTIPTLVLCGTGRRSSLGASILLMNGFKSVFNLAGGFSAALSCMKDHEGLVDGDSRATGPGSREEGSE